MAKRRRRSTQRKGRAPADNRGWLRKPSVWLATLSTVVGVATGMFTLRDQFFPRESGTAAAVSVPAYQQGVGRVCDELNDNDADRARDDRAIRKRLKAAKTTTAQRNAIVDSVRRTVSRTAQVLASFNALETPQRLFAESRTADAAWDRYLARLRDYALKLDRVRARGDLVRALEGLASQQPAFGRDSDDIRSGLKSLGGADCDLQARIVTRTYTLPPLKGKKGRSPATASRVPANPPTNTPPYPTPPPSTPSIPVPTPTSTSGPSVPATPPQTPNRPPAMPPAPPEGPANQPSSPGG